VVRIDGASMTITFGDDGRAEEFDITRYTAITLLARNGDDLFELANLPEWLATLDIEGQGGDDTLALTLGEGNDNVTVDATALVFDGMAIRPHRRRRSAPRHGRGQ
jgi:hypothetical protein